MTAPRWIALPLAVGIGCVVVLPTSSQQVPPAPPVIRINVGLVQVDAVVTDSKGNPVTDLKADDFEVLQDGKPQVITSFEFVDVRAATVRVGAASPGVPGRGAAPAGRGAAPAPRGRGGPAPPPPPTRVLRPQQIRRTIALVVDDLGLSFDSIARVRASLKKWVDTEMQPGDLAAVIRTSAGMGSLQQFTADKRLLHSAIDLVQFHVGRVGSSNFAPLAAATPRGGPAGNAAFDEELSVRYSQGSMGAIQYVVQGLKDVPGRKSLVLFSESLRMMYPDGRNQDVEDRLRRLSDAANRSSVVIYGIDPRGLTYTGLTAEDAGGRRGAQVARTLNQRSNQLLYSQEGMQMLSEKTGGLFIHDNNDIAGALKEVVNDGNGYYLLGYQPDLTTFAPGVAKFHSITVRLKRPGLNVRSRTGFYGTPDRGTPPPRTPIAQITRALSAPFATGDLQVRLTTLFAHSDKEGSYINAMLYFDAHDLTFSPETDGKRTAEVDIAAVTFDVEGTQIDGANKTWRFQLDQKTYDEVLKSGIVYSLHVPVKKSGAYQMRVVLRDSGSQQLGSATQFVEIPDVKNGHLTISGIALAAEQPQAGRSTQLEDGPLADVDPNGTPAVRIFKQGTSIDYIYEIFNAHLDRSNKPQLEVQTRLFRDGEEIHTGNLRPLDNEGQQDSHHMIGAGQLQLTQVAPGDYALQVIVTDKLASEKYRVAAQSMDFEVRQ